MPIKTAAPVAVAYFNVYVPIRRLREVDLQGEARSIVDRYLYQPYEIIDVVLADDSLDEPFESYCVKVRGEFFSQPEYFLRYQTDRLASGSLITSEPVMFRPEKN